MRENGDTGRPGATHVGGDADGGGGQQAIAAAFQRRLDREQAPDGSTGPDVAADAGHVWHDSNGHSFTIETVTPLLDHPSGDTQLRGVGGNCPNWCGPVWREAHNGPYEIICDRDEYNSGRIFGWTRTTPAVDAKSTYIVVIRATRKFEVDAVSEDEVRQMYQDGTLESHGSILESSGELLEVSPY
jgi:hypothetical protein